MREIEVKILDINRQKIEQKLLHLGAKKIFEGEIYALFFTKDDTPVEEDIHTIRLRKMGEKAFLTVKKKINHPIAKVREEHEVEVSSFPETKKILEVLGFNLCKQMRKKRTSYALNKVHFEIDKHTDEYSYVPEYLEIEAPDLSTLYEYVTLLGYSKQDCKPWTILDIAEYLQQEKICKKKK